jgi:ribonuclease HI/pterin-4a-carbinolamine dehydratase
MWQETKHGLYKQFNFTNFDEAFRFMTEVAKLADKFNHHPRWENEWSVVQIWLITHEGEEKITEKDREMADAIDKINITPKPEAEIIGKEKQSHGANHLVKIFADGGSRGNPGPSASGYVIFDEDDNLIVQKGAYLGITTNNQAEYTALKLAVENAVSLGAREVQIFMDSLLVINQMKGIFKVKNRDLWPLNESIKDTCKKFRKVTFQHVPRELNKLADAEVNKALDASLAKNSL